MIILFLKTYARRHFPTIWRYVTLYVFNDAINIGMLNLLASGTSESYFSSSGVLNGTNFPVRV